MMDDLPIPDQPETIMLNFCKPPYSIIFLRPNEMDPLYALNAYDFCYLLYYSLSYGNIHVALEDLHVNCVKEICQARDTGKLKFCLTVVFFCIYLLAFFSNLCFCVCIHEIYLPNKPP